MRRLLVLLLAFDLLAPSSPAQTNAPPRLPPELLRIGIEPVTPGPPSAATVAEMQSNIDHLTQSNRELLDLLKKQQGVLEDIQYDRRQQSRQIQSLEEHLEETLLENSQLQTKIAKLEATAAAGPASVAPSTPAPASTNAAAAQPTPAPLVEPPPPPPSTYLPAPESEGAPGTKSWHRLFTLSGSDGQNSDLFHIQGPQWRVLWHNQDKEGKVYKDTSALFISAFPKDDTIPQRVCSKVGSGGDSTELVGRGNYYLKIEASGGKWELAVEDFR